MDGIAAKAGEITLLGQSGDMLGERCVKVLMNRFHVFQKLSITLVALSVMSSTPAIAQEEDAAAIVESKSAVRGNPTYDPISSEERLKWFIQSTVGPKSLAGGVVSASWGTAINYPKEYGPHWSGFGKRYGMRLTGVATGNAIEAGVGRLWGEDPRYFRSVEKGTLARIGHASVSVFTARHADGRESLAIVRYTGIIGNNFLSNTWRVPSESTTQAALRRTALGFAAKLTSNLFDEFWPSIRRKFSRR